MTQPQTLAPSRVDPRALATTCVTALLVLMVYTAPMMTLPETARDLGAGISGQTWILNGMPLGLAALLLVTGAVADDVGRRRVLVGGAMALAVGSVLVAVAATTLVFVVGRVVQGGSSAALLATSLGLVGQISPPGPARLRATGLWGSMVSAGIALGPLLVGGLSGLAGWRTAYAVFAVAGLALAVAGLRTLPADGPRSHRGVDLAGVLTLGIGVTVLLVGVTRGRLGWTTPSTLLPLGLGLLLLAAFARIERRADAPMIDLGLLRHGSFLAATTGAFVTGLGVIGLMSYLAVLLQAAQGFSPLGSALLFAIWSGTAFVVAQQTRRLRAGARQQLALGLALSALGALLLLGFVDHWSWSRVVLALVVSGSGSGLANAALPRLAIGSVPTDRSSMGSGANNTARYVGSSFGVAMVVTVVTGAGDLGRGADLAVLVSSAITLLGAGAVLLLRREARDHQVPGLQRWSRSTRVSRSGTSTR